MSFAKRLRAAAGVAVAGTAIGAASMMGFAGTANAAGGTFKLCNQGAGYAVQARFDGSTLQFVPPGKCVTKPINRGESFSLKFDRSGNGSDLITTRMKTRTDGNTLVRTGLNCVFSVSKL